MTAATVLLKLIIADFEGDNVVEFQGENEEPWGELIIDT